MLKSISRYLLGVFAISGLLLLNRAFSGTEEPLHLFTDDEAGELRYSDEEWDEESIPEHAPDSLERPSILIEEPDVILTDKGPEIVAITPAKFFIFFKQNDSPLDLETLLVWGEKYFFKKDITSRVLPYIKTNNEGAVLHVKSIYIPKGNYKVGISIADINGRETKREYRLKVD